MNTTRKLFLFIYLCFAILGTSAQSVVSDDCGVTLQVGAPKEGCARMVRLHILNDNIVRLQATPESFWQEKHSLMVLPQPEYRDFKVRETDAEVVVSTAKMDVRMDKSSGRVSYYDANGTLLLAETAEEGKYFSPFTVPERETGTGTLTDKERHAWSWKMQFDSPKDEAFYGLGQHQSEELNMKGRNEDLFQYNTKIAVPFVISSRRYGILWDSYSFCRFGNPEDYLQLHRAFTLYDKNGNEGGLTGTYTDRKGRTLVRQEDSLYFENSETIVNLPKAFDLNGSQVTYEGYVSSEESRLCRFILYYAGYVRVLIDGKEVVAERWRTAWNPNAYKFEHHVSAGRRHHLRIEWRPDGGVSYCGLRVATPRSEEDQQRLTVWNEMARDMDYYFICGASIDEVIGGYRRLTGRMQVMPRWALGFWQSRERYKTADELVGTLAEFRRRHIPVDNIVQDWNYWEDDAWGSHEFDVKRYSDPQAMIDSVHSMHGRFMISVWPKFYHTTKHYKDFDSKGWMYRQAVRDSIRDWVGPGYIGSFYDAYSEGARRLFWQQLDDKLYSGLRQRIDAWWMDASEPNVRDCTPMWYRKALCGPTALGSSTEYFNAYSLVNAEAIYNGQRSVNPDSRVFLLTRSGFAGLQRYGTASWSGDIGTRWEDMRAQMTAGLNYSVSGLPFWGMDAGGFCVENRYVKAQKHYDKTGEENADLKEWRELQARWHQFACFVPLYRAHGQWPRREAWNIAPIGHEAYESIVYHHRLRYHLMPYLYSMAGWVHFHDYTMMRPLVMDHTKDTRTHNIKDQWMFGPALMACPVSEYEARSRQVYLPENGGWYDFYSGAYHEGGQTIMAEAAYGRMPLYVPAGSILPIGEAMEWSDEKPAGLIRLHVFTGKDADFELYEDENTNYGYEQGRYAIIPIHYDNGSGTLTIGKRRGSFPGMLGSRRFQIIIHKPNDNKPVDLNPAPDEGIMIRYEGREKLIKGYNQKDI